jgi:hypothetical protein
MIKRNYGRRELLETGTRTVVGGGLISVMSGVATSQSGSDEEWSQPFYDATNNGYVPNNTGPPTEPDTQIGEQWRVDAQEG